MSAKLCPSCALPWSTCHCHDWRVAVHFGREYVVPAWTPHFPATDPSPAPIGPFVEPGRTRTRIGGTWCDRCRTKARLTLPVTTTAGEELSVHPSCMRPGDTIAGDPTPGR